MELEVGAVQLIPAAFRTGHEAMNQAKRELAARVHGFDTTGSRVRVVSLIFELGEVLDVRPRLVPRTGGRVNATVKLRLERLKRLATPDLCRIYSYVILTVCEGIFHCYGLPTGPVQAARRDYETLPDGSSVTDRLGLLWGESERRVPVQMLMPGSRQPVFEIELDIAIHEPKSVPMAEIQHDIQTAIQREMHDWNLGECVGGESRNQSIAIFLRSDRVREATKCARNVVKDLFPRSVVNVYQEGDGHRVALPLDD